MIREVYQASLIADIGTITIFNEILCISGPALWRIACQAKSIMLLIPLGLLRLQ